MAKRRPAKSRQTHPTQWQRFSAEFPDNGLLTRELLYALPTRLIKALRAEAPELFKPEVVRFELRLRQLSATGFYREQTMFSNVLDGHFSTGEEFERQSVTDWEARSKQEHETRFREILSTDNLGSVAEEHRQRIQGQLEAKVRARMRGYAGWLVTHPEYWRDVHEIEVADWKALQRYGVFPSLHKRFGTEFREGAPLETDLAMALGHLALLRNRWCLEDFTTFQIPEPLRPGLMIGDQAARSSVQQDGIAMFLPWPLLADSSFSVDELFEYHRKKTDLRHLDDWLRVSTSLSYKRCGQLLDLYVYRECALQERYGERMIGQTEQIDRAFAAYWRDPDRDSGTVNSGVESVKKLRGILTKRLALCRQAVDQRDDELRRESGSPTRQGPAETMLVASPAPARAASSGSARGRASRQRRASS